MRTLLGWLLAIALTIPLCAGCSGDGNDDPIFGGSDTWIERLYIGNVPVREGSTVNVPLANTYKIRFEVSRAVTQQSLAMLFDFQIRIENIDTGYTFLITDANIDENGDLVWVDGSNRVIEFRMTHDMSYITSGGHDYYLGELGDMFRVTCDFMVGQVADGTQFSLWGDEFYVVWTESSQGYGG